MMTAGTGITRLFANGDVENGMSPWPAMPNDRRSKKLNKCNELITQYFAITVESKNHEI